MTVGEKTGKVAFSGHKKDMARNKAGIWNFDISDFKFDTCISKLSQISEVTIVNGGNDGWNIASVVTMVGAGKTLNVLSSDIYVNRWIDGNEGVSRLQFPLTLYKP